MLGGKMWLSFQGQELPLLSTVNLSEIGHQLQRLERAN